MYTQDPPEQFSLVTRAEHRSASARRRPQRSKSKLKNEQQLASRSASQAADWAS